MTISRRRFLSFGSLGIGSIGLGSLALGSLGGCGTRGSRRDAGTGMAGRPGLGAPVLAPTPHVDHDEEPPPMPSRDIPTTCGGATAANIEGPFYKAGAPHKASMITADDPGERLVISGSVLTGDCEPVR